MRFASIVCDLIFINNRMGMGAVMGFSEPESDSSEGELKMSR